MEEFLKQSLMAKIIGVIIVVLFILGALANALGVWQGITNLFSSGNESDNVVMTTATSILMATNTPVLVTPTLVPTTPAFQIQPTSTIMKFISGPILFEDNFEQGISEKWTYSPEEWRLRIDETGNHFLCARATEEHFPAIATAGSTTWKDYTLEVDVMIVEALEEDTGSSKIMVRMNEEPKVYYEFYFSKGFSWLDKVGPDLPSFEDLLKKPPEFLDRSNGIGGTSLTWKNFKIEVKGPNIVVNSNDRPFLQANDPNFIDKGAIGLMVTRWHVCFDNLRVTELESVN